jgi:hypothetical protein
MVESTDNSQSRAVGAEIPVMSRYLQVFVDQSAEAISP